MQETYTGRQEQSRVSFVLHVAVAKTIAKPNKLYMLPADVTIDGAKDLASTLTSLKREKAN